MINLSRFLLRANILQKSGLLSRTTSSIGNIVPEERNAAESTLLLSEEDRKDFFRLNDLFTVEDLFNARCHFGHKDGQLDPHMRPHIFGKRLGVLIINLDDTSRLLRRALRVTAEIAYRNGIILFINSNRQTTHLVETTAKECGEYAFCRQWRNETFTDARRTFGAITRLPDLCILFSTLLSFEQHPAVKMCAKMLIPTVAICDTNSDPTLITYPVPANDDTPQSTELFCRLFKTAILRGKEKRGEIIEKYGEDFYYKTII